MWHDQWIWGWGRDGISSNSEKVILKIRCLACWWKAFQSRGSSCLWAGTGLALIFKQDHQPDRLHHDHHDDHNGDDDDHNDHNHHHVQAARSSGRGRRCNSVDSHTARGNCQELWVRCHHSYHDIDHPHKTPSRKMSWFESTKHTFLKVVRWCWKK